jgi:endonuclease/exonuclease/phosphatase (EEP) superfamily protein YafD
VVASQKLRQVHAEKLLGLLPILEPPVLLVGDFNGSLGDPVVRRIQGARLDAFQVGGWGFGYTFASDLPLVRIDHVLAPDDWTVESARVLARSASDHRALVVRLGRPALAAGRGGGLGLGLSGQESSRGNPR